VDLFLDLLSVCMSFFVPVLFLFPCILPALLFFAQYYFCCLGSFIFPYEF
jgi:hypothetical protein